MLKRLQIRNFLANKKLSITFDEKITTIIGKSAIGKSSAIRALEFVCRNVPAGIKFIHWGEKMTTVRLSVNKKHITRKRGTSLNTYTVDKKDPLKAFGQCEVPDEVISILNMSDINFQGQFEPHYWFNDTAGEVGRRLNKIVNLEVIDTTLTAIASEVRCNQSELSVIDSRLELYEERQQDLAFVPIMRADFDRVERLRASLKDKADSTAICGRVVGEAVMHQKNQFVARNLHSGGILAVEKGAECLRLAERVETLSDLLKSAREWSRMKDLVPPSVEALDALYEQCCAAQEHLATLERLLGSVKQLKERKELWQRNLRIRKAKLEKLTGGVCPLCHQPTQS